MKSALCIKAIAFALSSFTFCYFFSWDTGFVRFEFLSLLGGIMIVAYLFQEIYFSTKTKRIVITMLCWATIIEMVVLFLLIVGRYVFKHKPENFDYYFMFSIIGFFLISGIIFLFKKLKRCSESIQRWIQQ